jgi:hypothetical protein
MAGKCGKRLVALVFRRLAGREILGPAREDWLEEKRRRERMAEVFSIFSIERRAATTAIR